MITLKSRKRDESISGKSSVEFFKLKNFDFTLKHL